MLSTLRNTHEPSGRASTSTESLKENTTEKTMPVALVIERKKRKWRTMSRKQLIEAAHELNLFNFKKKRKSEIIAMLDHTLVDPVEDENPDKMRIMMKMRILMKMKMVMA